MLKSVLASMAQGTLYSVILGTTYKIVVNKDWDMTKLPALSAFWAGFVVPSGIGWSLLNTRILKALSLPKDPIGLIRSFNGKFIAADVLLNHFLYQAFLATTISFFMGALNYDKIQDPKKKVAKEGYKEIKNHFQQMQKDLFVKRLQITAISLLIDIFASRFTREYRTGSKYVFLKTNILNFYWHQYILYKVENNPVFSNISHPPLASPQEANKAT